MKKCKCIFCGSDAKEYDDVHPLDYILHVKCPACGTYLYQKDLYWDTINKYKNSFASYLYYNKNRLAPENKTPFCFVGSEKYYNKIKKRFPWGHRITEEEIKSFMPTSFSETITRILLNYASKAKFFGGIFVMNHEEVCSSLFVRRYDEEGNDLEDDKVSTQEWHIMKYLLDNKYLEAVDVQCGREIEILPEGWKRIEKYELDNANNKDVFISMSFGDETNDIRECIKEAVYNAGYNPVFIDEKIHNKQIVPEMLRLIRECKFLIIDITQPNYGAYYEAGYALGLGKEVIVGCSEEIFHKKYTDEEEKKYEKYLKPHFDIAQKQILVWNDLDDYKERLEEWIKALIG